MLNGAYYLLDLVPKGRGEAGLPSTMAWLRHHDRYGDRAVPLISDLRFGRRLAADGARR